MAQAALRPTVRGPTFIRLLARLAEVDVAAPGASLPDRLGQWLDWKHALALSSALDACPVVCGGAETPSDELAAECARAREALDSAIRNDPLLAAGTMTADEADYAVMRQSCLTRQRAMQATTGRLRGKLRDALAQASTDAARLAEVDAVMEVTLSPREHGLLAKVPTLLERRFEFLRSAGQTHWLDTFRRDMQSALLAELELRFQPVDALLAALCTTQESA